MVAPADDPPHPDEMTLRGELARHLHFLLAQFLAPLVGNRLGPLELDIHQEFHRNAPDQVVTASFSFLETAIMPSRRSFRMVWLVLCPGIPDT